MASHLPLVSVIMSVFNGEKYIKDAIQSVLNQSYQNWELIIINDGSFDSTELIISQFQDNRIRYLFQENMGLTKALNVGINMSRGKYVARLDADDRYLQLKLARQVEFLEKNSEFSLLGCYYYSVDVQQMTLSISKPPIGNEDCRKLLKSGNAVFLHSSVLFKKEIGSKLVMYDESFKQAQDYRLWIELASVGKIGTLPEVLCLALRNSSSSITSKRSFLTQNNLNLNLACIACSYLSKSKLEHLNALFVYFKNTTIKLLQKNSFITKLLNYFYFQRKQKLISFSRINSLDDIVNIWNTDSLS